MLTGMYCTAFLGQNGLLHAANDCSAEIFQHTKVCWTDKVVVVQKLREKTER